MPIKMADPAKKPIEETERAPTPSGIAALALGKRAAVADAATHSYLDGLNEAQREAIECCDRSVIVSAAAGSGKTAVIAERCAYLVCDAPGPFRCDVDQLLVVTFTKAAATEMRSRVRRSVVRRLSSTKDERRLRQQLALLDAAQISTIHAFCQYLLRRHFNEAGVDPAAVVLSGEEQERILAECTIAGELGVPLAGNRLAPPARLGA